MTMMDHMGILALNNLGVSLLVEGRPSESNEMFCSALARVLSLLQNQSTTAHGSEVEFNTNRNDGHVQLPCIVTEISISEDHITSSQKTSCVDNAPVLLYARAFKFDVANADLQGDSQLVQAFERPISFTLLYNFAMSHVMQWRYCVPMTLSQRSKAIQLFNMALHLVNESTYHFREVIQGVDVLELAAYNNLCHARWHIDFDNSLYEQTLCYYTAKLDKILNTAQSQNEKEAQLQFFRLNVFMAKHQRGKVGAPAAN